MKKLGLFFLLSLIASCGGGGGDAGGSASSSVQKNSYHRVNLAQSIQDYSVQCANELDCPDTVARLVITDHKRTWSCTGFLIDRQTIATAGHCLPPEISQRGRSCAQKIYAIFPEQTSLIKTPIECDHVLEVEKGGEGDYDYAFLRLKESYPAPFVAKINRDNRLNGQQAVIYKVDPNLFDEKKSLLTKTQCQLKDSSLLSLTFSSARSSQIQYSGCQSVQGNSGAPVMNSRSEVVAIHNSSTKATSSLSLMLSQYARPSLMSEFSSATNFGCLCPQGESYRRCLMSASCRSQNDEAFLLGNRQLILDRVWSSTHARVGLPLELKNSLAQNKDDLFEWESTLHYEQNAKEFRIYLTQRPVCLKKQYKFSDIEFINQGYFKKEIPFCQLKMTLNSHYEITKLGPKDQSCQFFDVSFQLDHPIDLELRAQIKTKRGQRAPEIFSMGRKIPYCL